MPDSSEQHDRRIDCDQTPVSDTPVALGVIRHQWVPRSPYPPRSENSRIEIDGLVGFNPVLAKRIGVATVDPAIAVRVGLI